MAGGIPQNLLASMSVRLGMDTKAFSLGAKQAQSNIKGFQASLGGLKTAFGAVFGAVAVRQLISFGKASIDAYSKVLEAETKLREVMHQRFGASESVIKSVINLTEAQEKLGVVEADVQVAGAQQLATFLRHEKALKNLIPAMNNLIAQQKGVNSTQEDAVNVANMMGKVLDGQVGALRRVGITFSETQEKMLKGGNEMERAATLAQVITDNVGNMNEALAATDLGKMKQLKQELGSIQDEIGKKLLPIWSNYMKTVLDDIKIWTSEHLTFYQKLNTSFDDKQEKKYLKLIGEIEAKYKGFAENFDPEKLDEILSDPWTRATEGMRNYGKELTKTDEIIKTTVVPLNPLLEEINKKIEDASELWESSVTKGELNLRMQRLEQLREEKKLLESIGTKEYLDKLSLDKSKKANAGLSPLTPISATSVGETTEPAMTPTLTSDFIDKYAMDAERLQQINDAIQDSFADLTASMTEAFVQMAMSGEGFQPGLLLLPIANVAENLGKLAISTGIATMGIKKALESLQGPVAIAAGIALVAVAAAVKAKMSSMASGASVSTSLPSSYSGSSGSGDFNVNRNYGERAQVIRVELDHKIEGDAIRLVSKRAELTHSMQS